jgi:hypothetical protein
MTVEVIGRGVLLGFPLRVWKRQQEYTYDLLREFQLLTLADDGARNGPPGRLLAVADEFIAKYGSHSAALTAEREAALARGEITIDSSVPLLVDTPELVESVRALLVEVDDYCRRGRLLTMAPPPDVAALREWTMTEMLRQFHGGQPERWPGALD